LLNQVVLAAVVARAAALEAVFMVNSCLGFIPRE
jgi:hypothetical protein